MTKSTISRIRALYLRWIGYDPIGEGWSAREALEILHEFREARDAR